MVHSSSPYSSPSCDCSKKDGSIRMSCDHQNLMLKQHLTDIPSPVSRISLIILVKISNSHF